VLHLVSLTAEKVAQSPSWIGPKLDRIPWGSAPDPPWCFVRLQLDTFAWQPGVPQKPRRSGFSPAPHAAISSSRYSWCRPPRTQLPATRWPPGVQWPEVSSTGMPPVGSGMPGPRLECVRPLL